MQDYPFLDDQSLTFFTRFFKENFEKKKKPKTKTKQNKPKKKKI